ncbi:cyanophycin synthetase [Tardiphaga sp.]|uniref:bifunctional folylpolyglutamate synthase/dihydrofolate synthase n=1 Tax=Tardiphaga sp. TaxID=1926292 RepID=UPI0026165E17|nr:cyanophycin synthetase [Tardiphaga sp.]MDB5619709.1 FolC bifunctional protein [Tardiphaga sp.]
MFNLPKYGEGVCLTRLAALLDALSIDRARLQRNSVVVTGSNGKGSTAAFAASIGHAAGLRTGLFTSPHLYRFNERFRIDGEEIGDDALADLVLRVATAIADLAMHGVTEIFGAFEAQFALACLHFQESDCDFAVFEAGIGGRYDPVRLVGAKVTCVTSVDYEHVHLLGNTLELIASDKSDACAAGGTIIYGENCRPLQQHLAEYNRPRHVSGTYVRDDIVIDNEAMDTTRQQFDLRISDQAFSGLAMSLLGDFQFNNAAIAAGLFVQWSEHARPDIALDAAIRDGLRQTRWPGRLEIVQGEPLIVIDVGHTPDGVSQALQSLRAIHGEGGWLLVLGVSGDKSVEEIAKHLAPSFDSIICTSAHHKGADARVVGAAARKANSSARIHLANTIEDAVRVSQQLARTSGQKIYVAGGLFVAIEYATVLRGGNASELQFF